MSAMIFDVPVQRTAKGLEFDKWYDKIRDMLDSPDPVKQRLALVANEDFVKGMKGSPTEVMPSHIKVGNVPAGVHVDQLLNNFSVRYVNDEYIGRRLMTTVPVSKQSDKYVVHDKRDAHRAPDDRLANRGIPNEIKHSHTKATYATDDRGLMDFVDLATVQNQDAPLNEVLDSLAILMNAIELQQEIRLASLLCTGSNYAGNTTTAATVWNDSGGGTIETDVRAADAAMWNGGSPTQKIGFCELETWNAAFLVNPKLFDKFKYSQGGALLTQQIARFFGLDDILIGRARKDTANEGQSASYSRVWTQGVFGMVRVAPRPTVNTLHWGSVFRLKNTPLTTSWFDPKPGLFGANYNKVTLSEDEKVVAGDAGYLLTSVTA